MTIGHLQTRGWRRLWCVLPLLGAQAVMAASPVCPDNSYVIHQAIGGPVAAPDELTITDGQVSLGRLCPSTPAVVRGQRKGTKVKAKWANCPALGDRPQLVGSIDKGCNTFTGILKIKFPKLKIPVVGTPARGESLRMATYNVQMLPSHFAAGTSETVAKRMVERLLAGGYDFVALNEVFDEDAKEIFADGLKAAFPYYISDLDSGSFPNEDSGLSFYSRLPFEDPLMIEFSLQDLIVPPNGGPGVPRFSCHGSDCSKVRFIEFQSCEDDDCFAEKGVGYVRLRNPETGTRYNVLFTHMQATYLDDSVGDSIDVVNVRVDQMNDIRRIVDTLETAAFPLVYTEPILVMGDLNIDGDLGSPDVVENGEPDYLVKNIHEYNDVFRSPPDYWSTIFTDGWAVDNAPKPATGPYDRGNTNAGAYGPGANDGARLDFILHRGTRRCMQHMTLAHNLRWSPAGDPYTETGFGPNGIGLGGAAQLSDHIGVNADWNRVTDHCSPATAESLAPQSGQPLLDPGTIRYPGSIVWYRIEEAGTYSFAVESSNGTDFRVYAADDLSTPLPQFKQLTTTFPVPGAHEITGKVFRAPTAPFFIRVFNPKRSTTGSFALAVMKHDCRSREFACALAAGEERQHDLGAQAPLNGLDEAWFVAASHVLPAGLVQDLTFRVLDVGVPQPLHLDLEDATGNLLAQALTPSPDPEHSGASQFVIPTSDGDGTKVYLVVRRAPAGGFAPPYPLGASHFRVRWETNLTILFGGDHGGHALQLWCHEENDPALDDGDDEVFVRSITADGDEVVGSTDLGDFDAGTRRSLEDLLDAPLYFFDQLDIELREVDGGAHQEDDVMMGTISALAGATPGPSLNRQLVMHDQDGAGTYSLYYNLAHGFDE